MFILKKQDFYKGNRKNSIVNAKNKNAVIWYAKDAFDPSENLNGRRVAGASFLKGYFDHAEADEFVSLVNGRGGAEEFKAIAKQYGVTRPVRSVFRSETAKIFPLDSIFISTPNFHQQLWQRSHFGHNSYSVCGLTHTISTAAVMEGMYHMRHAPQQEWDGIICTSPAVRSSLEYMFDRVDSYLLDRFGKVPPRPQLPVIPLGVNTQDFAADPQLRAALRSENGWGEDDVVFLTVARLAPHVKFDPIPFFIALEAAQNQLGDKMKLHFVAFGIYADQYSEKVFIDAAHKILKSVSFHHFDESQKQTVRKCLSGADVFAFPIDNLQESFGLAPVEAMSAGLPIIASDWDGLKETVTEEVGFRVQTLTTSGAQSIPEGVRYNKDAINYAQYSTNLSAQVEINLPEMTKAIIRLARNKGLRRKFGANGLKRAKSMYDWSVVIPQMQSFWKELSEIRTATSAKTLDLHPFAPPPMDYAARFPSQQMGADFVKCRACDENHTIRDLYVLRRYQDFSHPFEHVEVLERVFAAIKESGNGGADVKMISVQLRFNPVTVARCYVWLLKYGFIERTV